MVLDPSPPPLTTIYIDAFISICVIWLILMCDMTHSYVRLRCDMTHSYVRLRCDCGSATARAKIYVDAFICAPQMWYDSLTDGILDRQQRKPRFMLTHSYVWHDSFICAPQMWLWIGNNESQSLLLTHSYVHLRCDMTVWYVCFRCDFGSATTRAKVYEGRREILEEEETIQKTTTIAYRAPEMVRHDSFAE